MMIAANQVFGMPRHRTRQKYVIRGIRFHNGENFINRNRLCIRQKVSLKQDLNFFF